MRYDNNKFKKFTDIINSLIVVLLFVHFSNNDETIFG